MGHSGCENTPQTVVEHPWRQKKKKKISCTDHPLITHGWVYWWDSQGVKILRRLSWTSTDCLDHPRKLKKSKFSKKKNFERNFLKGNITNTPIKSLRCQVLIKSCNRRPLRPQGPDTCSMQKTWLEAKENYENLPENSSNHVYEACKKSDSNSKYFFFYIKNTPGTESMSTGERLKKSLSVI